MLNMSCKPTSKSCVASPECVCDGQIPHHSNMHSLWLEGSTNCNVSCAVQSSLATMMSQLANLPGLRRLELQQSSGITGPLADTDPDTSSGLCTVILVSISQAAVTCTCHCISAGGLYLTSTHGAQSYNVALSGQAVCPRKSVLPVGKVLYL